MTPTRGLAPQIRKPDPRRGAGGGDQRLFDPLQGPGLSGWQGAVNREFRTCEGIPMKGSGNETSRAMCALVTATRGLQQKTDQESLLSVAGNPFAPWIGVLNHHHEVSL